MENGVLHPDKGLFVDHGSCVCKLLLAGILTVCAFTAVPSAAASGAWIQIDTRSRLLTVHSSDNRLLAKFRNISIGKQGAAEIRRMGDATTPLGTFHVAWINRHSPFRRFFGLDYPTAEYGERALRMGMISQAEHDEIAARSASGRLPPQDTALGGRIGIHGLGTGNPLIQERFNWTDGCIALPNAEIDRLARWVRVGTRVVIR